MIHQSSFDDVNSLVESLEYRKIKSGYFSNSQDTVFPVQREHIICQRLNSGRFHTVQLYPLKLEIIYLQS